MPNTKYLNAKNGIEIHYKGKFVQFLVGTDDPSVVGRFASTGSIYLKNTSPVGIYFKTTDLDNGWERSPNNTALTTISGVLQSQIDVNTLNVTDVINELTTLSGGTGNVTLPTLQLDNSDTTAIDTTWTNLSFDTPIVESNKEVIEYSTIDPSQILIKQDGLYSIDYSLTVSANSTTTSTYARILKNGSDLVEASEGTIRTYQGEVHELSGNINTALIAGDYITLQTYRSSDGTVDILAANFSIVKLEGIRGPQGEIGPPGIVTVSGSPGYFDAYDSVGGTSIDGSWSDIPFDQVREINESFFDYNVATGALEFKVADKFVVVARVTTSITSGTGRTDSSMRLVGDTGSGFIEIPGSYGIMYNRSVNYGENTATVTIVFDVSIGDQIKVQAKRDDGSSPLQILPNASSLTVFNNRGPSGKDGADGVDGAPGSGSSILVRDQNGSYLSNGPNSQLYFSGSGVSVSAQGDDTARVVISGGGGAGGVSLKDENIDVPNGPHNILNFMGECVSVSDSELLDGQAYISVTNTPPPSFGQDFVQVADATQSTTNSTSWQTKLTLNTGDLNEGKFRVGWYYEYRRYSTSSDFVARVVVDSADIIHDSNVESKDINSYISASGFGYIDLADGTHTIVLQYAGENSNTSYIRNTRIEFWRVE